MKIAGLNIEGSKVKASIVDRRLGSVRPLATDELELPANPEERDDAFNEALAKWKDSYGIAGVTVGMNLSHFSLRTIELPVRSDEDIKHALFFEMEKHLPLEPDEYIIDFHTLMTSKEGSRNLVLALRKEKVRWIFECLNEVGIKFLGLKCTALEAVNELLSTVNVTDALMIYPSENLFQIVGIRNSNPEFLKVATSRDSAIVEIERNLDNYGKSLYVTGGGSAMDFDRFAPRTLPLNMPNVLSSLTAGKRYIKTDFVPEEFSTPKKDYYPYALVILSVVCVTILFSSTLLAYMKDYRALKSVNSTIDSLKAETREVVEVERQIASANERYAFLSEFQYKKNTDIKIIAELSELLPKPAWLSSLSVDEKGIIEIDGFATRAADIITPLENSDLFRDVEFSSPITVREGTERFAIKMQLELMEEKTDE